MDFSDYIIYVDESGDHSLASIDYDFPVFALDFCIFEKKHYYGTVVPMIQEFKFKYFGHDTVVLHEHPIRKQKPPFTALNEPSLRARFIGDLTGIIKAAEFTIVAAVIDKARHKRRYVDPMNPYEIALVFCMERAYAFLKSKRQQQLKTHVIVERRGKREDDQLELVFRRICDGENRWGPLPGLEIIFADKRVNSAGLQLADLTARPIALHCLRPDQPNRAFEVIEPKIRRSSGGQTKGWGLKTFP
jgi:hypothetical protein